MNINLILFLILLVLKLCKIISWSWWWVTAPIWLSLVINIILTIAIEYYCNKGRKHEKQKK